MRMIRNFFVAKTDKEYPDIVSESNKVGLLYPAPHIYVYKFEEDNENEEWKHIKARPLCHNMALARDSALSNNSIGITIYTKNSGRVHPDAMTLVANIIRLISDDLGIKQYGIITDELNKNNAVDVLDLNSAVAKAPSIYTRRKL